MTAAPRHGGGTILENTAGDRREGTVVQVSLSEADAAMLREFLEARLLDLRREISHTDSARFRAILHQLEGMLQRVLAQLPNSIAA